MALKRILLAKQLKDKRALLEALEAKTAELEVREAELEKSILEMDPQNDDDASIDAITAFDKEKEENETAKTTLRSEIDALEAELAAEEEEAPKQEAGERKDKKMADIITRDSKEYVEAFARYIKTGKIEEARTLLTENATNGTVAVPTIVEGYVRTAWEKEGIMSLVRKSYAKGNLKIGFEISGGAAVVHTEGGDAVAQEELVLGVVNLTAESIKKWIAVSDEILDSTSEEFLQYIYDELAYRIAKKAADELIAKIIAAGTVSTTTAVGVPTITEASVAVGTIAKALGQLSDEATNPVIVMNKLTWSQFKTVEYGANYAVDPFEGLPVVFNNSMKSYAAATTGETYVIVGDFGVGAQANFPNGNDITIKYDDTTEMTKDLVRILGRQFVAVGVVGPGAFVKVVK